MKQKCLEQLCTFINYVLPSHFKDIFKVLQLSSCPRCSLQARTHFIPPLWGLRTIENRESFVRHVPSKKCSVAPPCVLISKQTLNTTVITILPSTIDSKTFSHWSGSLFQVTFFLYLLFHTNSINVNQVSVITFLVVPKFSDSSSVYYSLISWGQSNFLLPVLSPPQLLLPRVSALLWSAFLAWHAKIQKQSAYHYDCSSCPD